MDPRPRHFRPATLIALVLFAIAVGCGGDGEARSNHDRALEALADGELRVAGAAAEKAARGTDPEIAARGIFLTGNVAFAEAKLAAVQADTPEAEPFAFDVAIAYAKRARDAWRAAAMSRDEWPPATRNVERARRLLFDLEQKRREAEKRRARQPRPRPTPAASPPPPDQEEKRPEEAPTPEAAAAELTPEEVRRLLDRLAEKEREKLEVRKERRRETSAEVEKDW